MCDTGSVLSAASIGSQVAGGFLSADAAGKTSAATQQAYNMQAVVDRNNASLADMRAADAIQRGQLSADKLRRSMKAVRGKAKASGGASGIAMDVGSPLSVFAGMDAIEAQDTATIKKNAVRESFAYQTQASNLRQSANIKNFRASQENPALARTSSLLGTATQVAGSAYNLYNSGAFG